MCSCMSVRKDVGFKGVMKLASTLRAYLFSSMLQENVERFLLLICYA